MERLEKIIRRAEDIIGEELGSLDSTYAAAALGKLSVIRRDSAHPLHQALAACEPLRDSSWRLRCMKARTSRMRDSFLPTAVRTFNESRPR